MPKREGVDALGLPVMSSRSRPGSSNANHHVGPYPLGASFANSSSSLVNTNNRGQSTSEPNLAAFSGPVAATEAPHLSTAEAFFGRMTLTAPDNMRRKKLEEREKKKQVRKRRAERGAIAAATLANPPEVGPSHLSQAVNLVSSGLASVVGDPTTSRRRKRPALPTSNSSSNLQTYTLEQSRSRSPTRPSRPQSAQTSHASSRQASPERGQARRRLRAGSDGSTVESRSQTSATLTVAAPIYQPASGPEEQVQQEQVSTPTSQDLSLLPTAAQRRRDIYADLDTLGLPGADESDLEDQPPPFPPYATRPISPPRMPVEGEEWTEEMRRRQEEYEMNRPPDSPPPAFKSDDETRERGESGHVSSSDEEILSGEVPRERQEWEDDVAAGFTLEERIQRDQTRREERERQVESRIGQAQSLNLGQSQVIEEALPDVDIVMGKHEEEQRDPQPEVIANEESGGEPQTSIKAQAEVTEQAVLNQKEEQEQEETTNPPQEPLNLGKLVMEARARRASAAQINSVNKQSEPLATSHTLASSSTAAGISAVPLASASIVSPPLHSGTSRLLQSFASQPLKRVESQPLQDTATTSTGLHVTIPLDAPSQTLATQPSRAIHRRIASEGTAQEAATGQVVPQTKTRPTKVGTTASPKVGKSTSREQGKPAKSIKIRPRPSGESHSRFRDGASAAANRRMALWGPASAAAPGPAMHLVPSTIPNVHAISDGNLPGNQEDTQPNATVLQSLTRQGSSSSNVALTSAQEDDGAASSDSDDKWNKEEAAFQALQRRLVPAPIEDDSSEEDEARGPKNTDQRPGWFRSNSIDLAKPGSSVPKAPPPLVLGRSRGGGAEYSSSSESSSESGGDRMGIESDDGSLSPVEVDELQSEGRSSFTIPTRPSDKGKQPVRPAIIETDRAISAPLSITKSTLIRAGEFEEDSGSSHDFATDEEEAQEDKRNDHINEGLTRPPVGNRLKTLFSTPLNTSQISVIQPSAASRASIESLFETQIGAARQQRPPSLASRKSSQSINEAERRSSLVKQPSDNSLRARERANAYAALESKQRDLTNEQQVRLEALEEISKLQKAGVSGSTSASVNQDSLDALERLLSRSSFLAPSSGGQLDEDRRASLRRSGAINRHGVAAPFVNPRSSIAPRPLGRLPTITNATRHFPPSRQTTTESTAISPNPSVASFTPPIRRNGLGTPSWMAYIPENERRALPEPLEPVKKRHLGDSVTLPGGPPPLPLRSTGNRVSAMVERFEVQTAAEASSPVLSPRSPSREVNLLSHPSEEFNRDDTLRRRPPPPPPPSSWQRHRPVSGNIPSSPVIPSSTSILTPSTSQGEILNSLPVKPFKPPFLQQDFTFRSARQSSEQFNHASSSLLRSPSMEGQQVLESPLNEEVAPRPRPRPLPIPPIFASSAATSSNEQRHQEDKSEESDEEEDETNISPPEMTSSSSIPVITSTSDAPSRAPTREASLGYTDLDLFASRLADEAPADGTNYDDLHLLAEFLGPAKSKGATAEEVEALSVGIVEVLRKRVVGKKENGKDKIKLVLNLMGVKVERCGVCLLQFKEGNLACLFPCLHVLHEECATKLLRNTKLCPTCRESIA